MRDFAKLSPKFWISKSQKKMRDAGPEAMIVALYLLTSPHSNMLGFYYLPLHFIGYETGLGIEGASKGLRCAIEAGFCYYDEDTEYVWVCDMAEMQIGAMLKPGDKNCKGILTSYLKFPDNQYKTMFYDRYRTAYHMDFCAESEQKTVSSLEGASKPHRSKEKEKEKEKDKKQNPPNPPGGTGGGGFDFESVELPDWLGADLWREWGQYCIELGRPIKTSRGAMACISLLEKFRSEGHSPETVIRHTTANDWKTLSVKNLQVADCGGFIDLEGAFFRIIAQGKKPQNEAEKLARERYSRAGLRTSGEVTCRAAWRGYLTQAYRETGEKPI